MRRDAGMSGAVVRAVAGLAIALAFVGTRRTRNVDHVWDETDPGTAHYAALLRSRLDDQVAAHWREFSIIVASGSSAFAIGAAGLLFAQDVEIGARVLLGGMLLASVVAFALAYFSIQAGAIVMVGPLVVWEVAASFLIAGAQIAMPLWLGYVLRQHADIEAVGDVVMASRHWFGLYAIFAGAAAFTNLYEARRRHRHIYSSGVLPHEYERRQAQDRRGALASAVSAAVTWIAMAWWAPHWLILAALVYAYALVMVFVALFNQSHMVELLYTWLGERQ